MTVDDPWVTVATIPGVHFYVICGPWTVFLVTTIVNLVNFLEANDN